MVYLFVCNCFRINFNHSNLFAVDVTMANNAQRRVFYEFKMCIFFCCRKKWLMIEEWISIKIQRCWEVLRTIDNDHLQCISVILQIFNADSPLVNDSFQHTNDDVVACYTVSDCFIIYIFFSFEIATLFIHNYTLNANWMHNFAYSFVSKRIKHSRIVSTSFVATDDDAAATLMLLVLFWYKYACMYASTKCVIQPSMDGALHFPHLFYQTKFHTCRPQIQMYNNWN